MRTDRNQSSKKSTIPPVPTGPTHNIRHAQQFLERFGYLKPKSFEPGKLDKATSAALHAYQVFSRLEPSGALDQETVDQMSRGRCGMPDVMDQLRFVRLASWDRLELRFAFDTGTNDVNATDEFQAVRDAFQTWAAVIPMTFKEVSIREPHEIRIAWKTHDDDHPLGNGVLAHSQFPPRAFPEGYAPDLPLPLHFDDSTTTWAIGVVPGAFDVQTTALHEIGHLLGLAHSMTFPSVMISGQNPDSIFRDLQPDDIAAILGLYSRINRVGDSDDLAGEISALAAIRHGTQQVITAVRDGSSRLLLISWVVNDDGSVSRTGDSAGMAGELSPESIGAGAPVVDIARGSRYVVACATSAGKLKLISWDVSTDGAFTRAGDSGDVAGEAHMIKIVALSDTLFVTACQSGSGNLLLISWKLNPDGSIWRLHDSANAAGEVSEISLLDVSENNAGDRVATVVRNGSGDLHIILWSVGADGSIQRLGQALAGEATHIRAVRDTFGHLVTACRAGNGHLKLIVWTIPPAGDVVVREFDSGDQAGEVNDISLMSRPNGWVLAAVRNGSDKLQLILFIVQDDGLVFRSQSAEQATGEASLVTLCQEPLTGTGPVVTAVRAGNGKLKLITWMD